jgi:hypothetical protein
MCTESKCWINLGVQVLRYIVETTRQMKTLSNELQMYLMPHVRSTIDLCVFVSTETPMMRILTEGDPGIRPKR